MTPALAGSGQAGEKIRDKNIPTLYFKQYEQRDLNS